MPERIWKSVCAGVMGVQLLLSGCGQLDCDPPRRIVFPDSPVNLADLNSPYDDWNCGAPWDTWESGSSFLFSTNRKTSGAAFDVHPTAIRFSSEIAFSLDTLSPSLSVSRIANRINTGKDELGPTFFFEKGMPGEGGYPESLLFSRGDGGNHDLIALTVGDPADPYSNLLFPRDSLVEIPLDALNTPADEGYASWSRDARRFLFHSNRDGKYGIYQALIPVDSGKVAAWLRHPDTAGVRVSRVQGLVSDGQERCPFLIGKELYFVSDRPGGFGGFDIYRSAWDGSGWTTPENLGPRINSGYDEYRPLPFHLYSDEDALFFSSNRPGGKGGFDLYATSLKSVP